MATEARCRLPPDLTLTGAANSRYKDGQVHTACAVQSSTFKV